MRDLYLEEIDWVSGGEDGAGEDPGKLESDGGGGDGGGDGSGGGGVQDAGQVTVTGTKPGNTIVGAAGTILTSTLQGSATGYATGGSTPAGKLSGAAVGAVVGAISGVSTVISKELNAAPNVTTVTYTPAK